MKRKYRGNEEANHHVAIFAYVGTLSGLLLNGLAVAQSILLPPPAYITTPTALQSFQNDEIDVFAETRPNDSNVNGPFSLGPLKVRPHIFYQFSYADGILARTNLPVRTVIQQLSPGILLEVGNHLTLDYTPNWNIYSDNHFRDVFNQTAVLTWGGEYDDWLLEASQKYSSTSAPDIQTGTQTTLKEYLTSVSGSYQFNGKLSLDLAASQDFIFPVNSFGTNSSIGNLENTREWSTLDWLNYQFWPRLNVAVGLGLGYDDVGSSPSMVFEQYQGRIQWRATDKISFQLHGGIEDRQFLDGGNTDLISPVFDGAIQYQPFDTTKLTVSLQRGVRASMFQNRATEITSYSGGINQRILAKFYLDLNGGYQVIKYTDTTAAGLAGPNRSDDYYFMNVQISRLLWTKGKIALFYQLGDNLSSESGYSFLSHQVGVQLSYNF